jgi:hypothetical protein
VQVAFSDRSHSPAGATERQENTDDHADGPLRVSVGRWLDEARKFLERECRNRKERLGSRTFSVSERFTNAPPHLKFANGVATWSMRYDGDGVSVSRDFDHTADLVVEGGYQAALTAAQFVGMLAPNAMTAMMREVATMFGKDALRVKGSFKDSHESEILALLHDHMGRRTVENPDLAHRAARQGLTGKIREMEEKGYTVLERAISPEFADEVRSATLRALLPHQTFSMNWMLYHGREFEQLIQNPLLMTLLDASLGRGAVIVRAVADRLLRILVAMLTTRTLFDCSKARPPQVSNPSEKVA